MRFLVCLVAVLYATCLSVSGQGNVYYVDSKVKLKELNPLIGRGLSFSRPVLMVDPSDLNASGLYVATNSVAGVDDVNVIRSAHTDTYSWVKVDTVPLATDSVYGKFRLFSPAADPSDPVGYDKTDTDALIDALPTVTSELGDVDFSGGGTNKWLARKNLGGSEIVTLIDPDAVRADLYCVSGTDELDDTAGLQAAIDATPLGGTLIIPEGKWIATHLTVNKPMRIIGKSHSSMMDPTPNTGSSGDPLDYWVGGSMIMAASGGSNYLLNIQVTTSPGGSANPIGRNYENQLYGVEVANITFDGNDRTLDKGGLWLANVDHSLFVNCQFLRFQREAIYLYSSVRETTFWNMRTRFCGNLTANPSTSFPALNVTENADTADSHNNVFFNNSYWLFSMGDTVRVSQTGTNAAAPVRNIYFHNNMFHGIVDLIDGIPYEHDAYHVDHRLLVVEGVPNVVVTDSRLHVGGQEMPVVSISTNDVTGVLPEVKIFNSDISSHYAGGSSGRYGIHLQNGYLFIDGIRWIGHNEGSIEIESNGTLAYGPNNWIKSGLDIQDNGGSFLPWDSKGDLDLNGNDILQAQSVETSNVKSLNTVSDLTIDGLRQSSSTTVAIRSKDSGGALENKVVLSDGDIATLRLANETVLDVSKITTADNTPTDISNDFDSAASIVFRTLNEAETALGNTLLLGGGAGNRRVRIASAALDVATIYNGDNLPMTITNDFDSVDAIVFKTLNEGETDVANALLLGGGAGNRFIRSSMPLNMQDNWIQGTEVSSTPAAVSNGFVLFSRDNGGGKTELCVRFATGVVQVIATEP